MKLLIRPLTVQDLPQFTPLAQAAGLAAAIDYMADYLAWQPDGYLCGVDGDGVMVCSVGAQRFGRTSFIGAMCVDPAVQRQGLGGRILECLLEDLHEHGTTTSLLEATAMGAGLYEKLGFVTEHETGVFRRTASDAPTRTPPSCEPLAPRDWDALVTFDEEQSGLGRPRVIRGLAALSAGRAFITRSDRGAINGYIMSNSTRIGPWIADAAREALLEAILSVIYTPLSNASAVAMLEAHGFTMMRTMKRMRLGPAVKSSPEAIYALGTSGVG